jgi:hypothetical protein
MPGKANLAEELQDAFNLTGKPVRIKGIVPVFLESVSPILNGNFQA